MSAGIIQAIFNKSIHSLTIGDISNYFKIEQRETDIVEFKSYVDESKPGTNKAGRDKEKLSDVIRTICGFLNSDGGMLIWGAPKGRKAKGNELVYRGDLTPVDYKIEPDQFINKIASEIFPTPLRILFQPIELANEAFCYIFEVSKSEFAPHQYKGTYYMRMDGSTHAAPHHYVEALMKKISFPRIEATITFGQMNTFNNTAGIPMVISIYNLSKYQHEKNIEYTILSDGGDVLAANAPMLPVLRSQSHFNEKAKDILHFNMPYSKDFLLVTKRVLSRQSPIKVRLLLTAWGELSPVISSNYQLHVFCNSQNGMTEYDLTLKKENVYLIDANIDSQKSDKDRIEEANQLMLRSLEQRISNLPVTRILNEINGS